MKRSKALYIFSCVISLGVYYYLSFVDPLSKGIRGGGLVALFYCCAPILFSKNKSIGLGFIAILTILIVVSYFLGPGRYIFFTNQQ